MADQTTRTIRIAAALIDDELGRLLLVRKAGTRWFMQAGGKIEGGETPISALSRELREEISFCLESNGPIRYLGCFLAPAANEPGCTVEAEIYHVRMCSAPVVSAEIEEAVWVSAKQAETMPLAPLTRDHILALWRSL